MDLRLRLYLFPSLFESLSLICMCLYSVMLIAPRLVGFGLGGQAPGERGSVSNSERYWLANQLSGSLEGVNSEFRIAAKWP